MTRRTLIILLIVSGALNLFLVGIVAVSLILHWSGAGFGRADGMRLYRAVGELEEPQRSRARALLEEQHPQIRTQIKAVRAFRRALRRDIRDGVLTPAAIEAGFGRLHRDRGNARGALHALVRQIAETLPPEQRLRFYREAYRPRSKKRKWRKDGEDRK